MNQFDLFDVSDDRDIEEAVESLFSYYRENGFPNYNRELYDSMKVLEGIMNFDEDRVFNGFDVGQTMHGLGYLWTFFPHWIEITYRNQSNSLINNWNDDDKLRSLIRKTYIWQLKYGRGKFTENRLRQNAKVYCSKQSVSNFRPTAAKALYNRFGGGGVVWDMSAGWGGRLLGFMGSNCRFYYGTDPSSKSFNGLVELMSEFFDDNIMISQNDAVGVGSSKSVKLVKSGSECWSPPPNSVDLCFTSPPYFDTEHYSNEDTQSFLKYNTRDAWLEGYLRQTIVNCRRSLKESGYLILNISNTPNHDWLESETLRIAEEEGFSLIFTYQLILSSISGKGVKREPIFIFSNKTEPTKIDDIRFLIGEKESNFFGL